MTFVSLQSVVGVLFSCGGGGGSGGKNHGEKVVGGGMMKFESSMRVGYK